MFMPFKKPRHMSEKKYRIYLDVFGPDLIPNNWLVSPLMMKRVLKLGKNFIKVKFEHPQTEITFTRVLRDYEKHLFLVNAHIAGIDLSKPQKPYPPRTWSFVRYQIDKMYKEKFIQEQLEKQFNERLTREINHVKFTMQQKLLSTTKEVTQ